MVGWRVFAILIFSFLLLGCLQFESSVKVNASLPGEVNITLPTANQTTNQTNQSNASVASLPDSLKICFYGDAKTNGSEYAAVIAENLTLFRAGQNKTIGLEATWLDATSGPGDFSGCAVIVLKDDAKGKVCDSVQRMAIRERIITGNSGLIAIKEACTRANDDPAVFGWDYKLAGVIPAKMDVPGRDPEAIGTYEIAESLFDIKSDDPALAGMKNFNISNIEGIKVTPANTGYPSAYFRSDPTKLTAPAPYAIIQMSTGANYAYYFSYDPLRTPSILRRVIELLAEKYVG